MCTLFLAILMLPFFVLLKREIRPSCMSVMRFTVFQAFWSWTFYKCNDVAKRVKFVPLNENNDTSKEITGNGA